MLLIVKHLFVHLSQVYTYWSQLRSLELAIYLSVHLIRLLPQRTNMGKPGIVCPKQVLEWRRITLGKVAMQGLDKIWKDNHVSFQTKTRIVNAMIFQVILYGCETWIKTRAMEKKIDAEMWIWRKRLRVSCTENTTNESILMEIGGTRGDLSQQNRRCCSLAMWCEQTVWKRIWCWHAAREEEKETVCLQGRGGWRKNTLSGMKLAELRDATEDRDLWRQLTMVIARTLRVDSTKWQGQINQSNLLLILTPLSQTHRCLQEIQCK